MLRRMGYLKGFSCPASSSVDPHPLASYCLLKKTGERVIHPLVAFFFFLSLFRCPSFGQQELFVDLRAITPYYTKHTHTPRSTYLYRKLSIMKVRRKILNPLYISHTSGKANQKEISSHLSSSSSLPSPSPSQHSSHKPETSTTIFSADSHVLPTCRISAPLPTFTRVVRMAGFTREPWIRAENATVDLEEGEKA